MNSNLYICSFAFGRVVFLRGILVHRIGFFQSSPLSSHLGAGANKSTPSVTAHLAWHSPEATISSRASPLCVASAPPIHACDEVKSVPYYLFPS